VTGECIFDKIAASKKKGMWMGVVPLGYDASLRPAGQGRDRWRKVTGLRERMAATQIEKLHPPAPP